LDSTRVYKVSDALDAMVYIGANREQLEQEIAAINDAKLAEHRRIFASQYVDNITQALESLGNSYPFVKVKVLTALIRGAEPPVTSEDRFKEVIDSRSAQVRVGPEEDVARLIKDIAHYVEDIRKNMEAGLKITHESPYSKVQDRFVEIAQGLGRFNSYNELSISLEAAATLLTLRPAALERLASEARAQEVMRKAALFVAGMPLSEYARMPLGLDTTRPVAPRDRRTTDEIHRAAMDAISRYQRKWGRW